MQVGQWAADLSLDGDIIKTNIKALHSGLKEISLGADKLFINASKVDKIDFESLQLLFSVLIDFNENNKSIFVDDLNSPKYQEIADETGFDIFLWAN